MFPLRWIHPHRITLCVFCAARGMLLFWHLRFILIDNTDPSEQACSSQRRPALLFCYRQLPQVTLQKTTRDQGYAPDPDYKTNDTLSIRLKLPVYCPQRRIRSILLLPHPFRWPWIFCASLLELELICLGLNSRTRLQKLDMHWRYLALLEWPFNSCS